MKLNFHFTIGDTTTVTLYVSRSNAQFLRSMIQGTINCSWVFALLSIESKEKSFAAMGAANIPYVHNPKEGILFFFHKVADLYGIMEIKQELVLTFYHYFYLEEKWVILLKMAVQEDLQHFSRSTNGAFHLSEPDQSFWQWNRIFPEKPPPSCTI